MSLSYYMAMTDGEIVGHVLTLAEDASELSQTLAARLRVQTKLRADAEMHVALGKEKIDRLEREVRELKRLAEVM